MRRDERLSLILLNYNLIIFGIITFTYLIWNAPHWLAPPLKNLFLQETASSPGTHITLMYYLLGVVVLLGLYFLFRKITVLETNLDVAQQAQVTEKFNRAVKQLGSSKMEVKLAGIFTLERIARESEKYHWAIMEILTTYVRENRTDNRRGKKAQNGRGKDWKESSGRKTIPADIQTILTVIGRRRWIDKEIEQNRILDLQKAALQYGDLRRANLVGADLRGVTLEGAKLVGANLAGALLGEASLKNANLARANLVGTNIVAAKLESANLKGANLRGSNLENANLKGANLRGANLLNANLKGAFLVGADLEAANLSGVDLEDAFLMELY